MVGVFLPSVQYILYTDIREEIQMFKKRKEQQHQVGFAPIVAQLAHELKLVSFFDQLWTFNEEKVEITPG